MTRVLGFLHDLKGDMCRLGYLLILSTLIKDNTGENEKRLATRLQDTSTDGKDPNWTDSDFSEGLSSIALIPAGAVAKVIVDFAGKTRFFSFKRKSLDEKARLANKVFTNVGTSSNPLVLSNPQQIFLLKCLLEVDGKAIIRLMQYLSKNTKLTRKDIHHAFMEKNESEPLTGIYPQILEEEILTSEGQIKRKLELEYEDSKTWKEQREVFNPEEWGKSKLYAKYRHNVDPRPEWLVDLGLLNKTKGKFSTTDKFPGVLTAIEEWLEDDGSDFYSKVVNIYCPDLKKLEENDLMQEIVNSFQLIRQVGQLATARKFLVELTVLRCIINGFSTSETIVDDIITNMLSLYPKYIKSLMDPHGNLSIIRIKDDFKLEQ